MKRRRVIQDTSARQFRSARRCGASVDAAKAARAARAARRARGGFVSLAPASRGVSSQAGRSVAGQLTRGGAELLGELAGPILVTGFATYDAITSPYEATTECKIGPHADRFIMSVIDQLVIGNVPGPPDPKAPQPKLNATMVEGEEGDGPDVPFDLLMPASESLPGSPENPVPGEPEPPDLETPEVTIVP